MAETGVDSFMPENDDLLLSAFFLVVVCLFVFVFLVWGLQSV